MRKKNTQKQTQSAFTKFIALVVFLLFAFYAGNSDLRGYIDNIGFDNPSSGNEENISGNVENTLPDISSNVSNNTNENVGNLDIYYFDVGQADCIFLRCDDQNMLIDAGNNADGKLIVNELKSMGIDTIDYLIGTHAHEDHIGGLDDVIDNFNIENFYMPSKEYTSATYKSVLKSAENKNLEIVAPKIGDKFTLGSATCEVMSIDNDAKELNLTSIVIEVTNGDSKFLFTGDAEIENEEKRLWNDIDVLKVGHHGSRTSTSEDFIEQTKPEVAVISLGEGNSYGHPHKETMDLLNEYNVTIYRTDTQGTIHITSDGENYNIETLDIHLDGDKKK